MANRIHSTAIDVTRTFPSLPNAPIVEAVIEWRADPTTHLDAEDLERRLASRFQNYDLAPIHDIEATLGGTEVNAEATRRSKHLGFRLTSPNRRVICQFRLNMVAVSRLAPYEGWESFFAEAKSFSEAFSEWCRPAGYSRLGVRSISKISLAADKKASSVTAGITNPWRDFGIESSSFFHQDTTSWPDSPYIVRLVRAMDVSAENSARTMYLDIDVSLPDPVELPDADSRLVDMRFLKNLVFFSILRDAEKRFK
ncbi:MAG: TIGR04255 family protein [Planctomycetia bacterium]|jgi:uncharacterized protein (TIGR04255 family)|nr:TIGR04255 family protein [Planctomycetia bacterium]